MVFWRIRLWQIRSNICIHTTRRHWQSTALGIAGGRPQAGPTMTTNTILIITTTDNNHNASTTTTTTTTTTITITITNFKLSTAREAASRYLHGAPWGESSLRRGRCTPGAALVRLIIRFKQKCRIRSETPYPLCHCLAGRLLTPGLHMYVCMYTYIYIYIYTCIYIYIYIYIYK